MRTKEKLQDIYEKLAGDNGTKYAKEATKDIKELLRIACREQRDLCSDRSSIGNMEFVENAPEPEFN